MRSSLALAVLLSLLAGCAVGPRYVPPRAPVPPGFKEAPPAGTGDWKTAQPGDQLARGRWWELFGDPELSALEERIDVSNQQLARAEAAWRAARAVARVAKADFYPTIATSPSVTRAHGRPSQTTIPPTTTNLYQVPFDASWEADVFGRIRRNVEANVANAQAAEGDLEALRLTMHADLAVDWFELRGLDAQKKLLDDVVAAYATALQLTRNRHDQGIVSGVDVAQAETQLETTRVQSTDLAVARSQLEHAIAILVGVPPAELSIAPGPTQPSPPVVPLELPSELLERRPDIAASERRVAAANAQIGVATAAFFPRLLVSASAGWQSGVLSGLFSAPNGFWSLGPQLAQTIFSGGRRRAAREQARASYDGAVAAYRETVLEALQEVEDNLAASRILAEEAEQQAVAVAAAERLLRLSRTRYEGGITTYLEVIVAQSAALSSERAAVDLQTRRIVASVNLVRALGGGWHAAAGKGVSPPPATPAPDAATASSSADAEVRGGALP
ncbi:MAG TPA: efflux transporter outer membrane subunit [Vicinamibacteria bacterium]|nr:efflux transporter outer membrane subunit [Vicinamibacteria bacterium]